MGDRVSSFTLTFDGEAGTVKSVLAALKSQIKSDVADIQATADKLDVFRNLQQQAKDAAGAFFSTRQRVDELRAAIETIRNAGGAIGTDLTKSLHDAEKAAASARKEFETSRDRLAALRTQLTAAGVDTKNLAAEQQRLAAAARAASAAAAEQQAKQALGLTTLKDVTPEIQRLRTAYNTLSTSGTLSVKELAIAQQQLGVRTKELQGQVTTLGGQAKSAGTLLSSFFQGSIAPALGLAAVATAVGTAFTSSIHAATEYRQQLAELGTVTNLTHAQLDGIGEAAARLAEDLGLNLTDTLKGVTELLRSGVPADNVIDVLRVSAEAAKASLTDLAAGVRVTTLLLQNFGADTKDLPRLFDAIVQGAKDGGATLKSFADAGGPLLNVANSLNVPFDELVAVMTVLVSKSGNAEQSFADLTKILAKLDTTEARKKLADLGIEGKGLLDTFQQIGAKGLGLNAILDLGVASTRSAASIAALTSNASRLGPELEKIRASGGVTGEALAKIFDAPAERAKRLSSALDGLQVRLGSLFGTSSRAASVLAEDINLVNEVFDAVAGGHFKDALDASGRLGLALRGIPQPSKAAAEALKAGSVAALDWADKNDRLVASLARVTDDIARARTDLGTFSKDLVADIQAVQASLAQSIGDVNAEAASQIAALDRSVAASKATAATTLQIQTKLAADRLALIIKNEAEINAAINKAYLAHAASVEKGSKEEKTLALETAQLRLAASRETLTQLRAHYDDLVSKAQTAATQLRQIEQERVDFNRGIEQQLFAIKLEGLSSFDQYIAKTQEADRLIGEAQKAAAEGTAEGTARAKQFATEAIAIANQLGEVTDQNGVKVQTALQAQTTKVKIYKEGQEAVNTALDNQKKAATDSLDANKKGIDEVLPRLALLRDRYDELKKLVDAGLLLKVHNDEESIAKTLAKLDELTRPRTVTVTVNMVNADGTPAPDLPTSSSGGGNGEHFASGGIVAAPQRFARGGAVFSRPAWTKVPGIGSADTVPASLNAGSFVVRKSASQFYGDSLMGQLAGVRHYAAGGSVFGMNDRSNGTGTVTKADIQQYAETKWGFDPFSSKVYDPGNIGSAPGRTGTTAPETDPNKGFRSGDTFQDKFTQRVISLDTRPIPEQFITAANVVAYAKEMLNSVGQNNPLLGSLGTAVLQGIQTVSSNPNNSTALASLLQAAETIGANPYLFAMWGKTAGSPAAAQVQPEWFLDWLADRGLVDPSGAPTGGDGGLQSSTSGVTGAPGSLLAQNPLARSTRNFGVDVANRLLHPVGNLIPAAANNFGVKFFQTAIPAAGAPPIAAQRAQLRIDDLRTRFARPFAEGGGSTDTVPAMLTPGEFVVNKPAVDRIGAPLLWAINEMKLPKADLSYLLEAPRVARFATGGPVGVTAGATIMPTSSPVGTAAPTTININASAEDLFSAANIRRYFIPVWDDIQRRSRR